MVDPSAIRAKHNFIVVSRNFAFNQIHSGRNYETSNEKIGRTVIEIKWCAHLLYNTTVHHDNSVRHGHGFHLIMGNINHCRVKAVMPSFNLGSHLYAKLRIEVGQGLIEEKHVRVANNGAPHGDALTPAARELTRRAFEKLCKGKNVRSSLDTFVDVVNWLSGGLNGLLL